MRSKGFTLIELLAVIVILAIIALIAVPIVLNIIDNSKEQSVKLSVEHYFDAVEQAITREYLKEPTINLDGTYNIEDNGKKIKLGLKEITIEYDGEGVKEGAIVIRKGKVINTKNLKIDKWYVRLNEGEIVLLKSLPQSILITGSSFNSMIKTLANQSDIDVWTPDYAVTSIEFLSNGNLPYGYTLETLEKLPNKDVSKDNDKSIKAYYDNGKVYIYSDNLIRFNEDSSNMFTFFWSSDLIITFGEIDTSNVTNMNSMFYGYGGNGLLDFSSFDTSKVIDMSSMFSGYKSLQPLNLNGLDTTNVTNMSSMFSQYNGSQPLNLNGLDTSNVLDMSYMFMWYGGPDTLDLSSFDTSNVISMEGMFNGCWSLTSLDLTSFNTSKVTNMTWMFKDSTKLTSVTVTNDKWSDANANTTERFDGTGLSQVTYVEG